MTTVIVAVDGSDIARDAAALGLSLLRPADKVLLSTVVHLVDPDLAEDATGHAGATLRPGEVEAQHRDARAEGQAIVETAAATLRSSHSLPSDFEYMVLGGHPGRELCKLAEESGAVAIVIGTRGRGGVKRALLGSTSDHVVRNAPCPVVVTRSSGRSS